MEWPLSLKPHKVCSPAHFVHRWLRASAQCLTPMPSCCYHFSINSPMLGNIQGRSFIKMFGKRTTPAEAAPVWIHHTVRFRASAWGSVVLKWVTKQGSLMKYESKYCRMNWPCSITLTFQYSNTNLLHYKITSFYDKNINMNLIIRAIFLHLISLEQTDIPDNWHYGMPVMCSLWCALMCDDIGDLWAHSALLSSGSVDEPRRVFQDLRLPSPVLCDLQPCMRWYKWHSTSSRAHQYHLHLPPLKIMLTAHSQQIDNDSHSKPINN